MKKKERVVPKKNYYILSFLIVMVVVVTFLIFDMNNKFQNNKLEESYFTGYLNEVNENELDSIMTETTTEYFILITKTEDEDVYKFEKDLKKIIKKNDLRDNFVFINYTDNSDLSNLNKKFGSDIKTIPAILYFKDGVFVKSIDSKEGIIKASDFDKLLDEYEIKD